MTVWVLVILWVSVETGPGMDIGLFPTKESCAVEIERDAEDRRARGETGQVLSVCHPAKAPWVTL